MRKLNLKWIFALAMALPLMYLSSCKTDDGDDPKGGTDFQPVLDDNFSYTVDGNNVNFETTLTGNVWVTVNDVNHNFVDQKVTVNLPNKGDYTFTCSSLGSGNELTSEPFTITIDQDDLTFLNVGLWKSLSGGANMTKTWKLDMNANGEMQYFAGPMYFSGYEDADVGRMPFWAWDVLPEELPYTINGNEIASFFNWEPDYATQSWIMAPNDYGTITFDGTTGTVSTSVFGETANGSFSFDTTTWKMTLSGVVLPIDTARLNEPQYTDENLGLVRIFSLTDSAMQIGIKRSYEGIDEETGAQAVSEWTNVYNFIVDGYNYPKPEEFTHVPELQTSLTAADLVGTWKFAQVPMAWIAYHVVGNQGTDIPQRIYERWDTRADVVATISSWGLAAFESELTANDADSFVFNDDGTCTLAGISNTYSVVDGKLVLGTDLAGTEFEIPFAEWGSSHELTGTDISLIDVAYYGNPDADAGSGMEMVAYTPEGLWIGQQNGEKTEFAAFQLVKQ
jgi:hypothetical protein